jgi:predicted NUDIX family NTP pyrophosphohydrolase
MYRRRGGEPEVLLVHPGGPYFAGKDAGAWSLPKGEIEQGEEPFAVACRELAEETGLTVEQLGGGGPFLDLGEVVQRGGKRVRAWAFAGDWPAGAKLESNRFTLEWPPRSGRMQEFPEVDRAELFPVSAARRRINPAQEAFLDRLLEALD